MDELTRLLVQLLIAIACGSIATLLIPRQIPGKAVGLVIIGLLGVFIGEWISDYLLQQYQLPIVNDWLQWEFQGVPIIPSVIGAMIVLYLVTAFLSWGRYGNR